MRKYHKPSFYEGLLMGIILSILGHSFVYTFIKSIEQLSAETGFFISASDWFVTSIILFTFIWLFVGALLVRLYLSKKKEISKYLIYCFFLPSVFTFIYLLFWIVGYNLNDRLIIGISATIITIIVIEYKEFRERRR